MRIITVCAALFVLVTPLASALIRVAIAQTLAPSVVFEGTTRVPATNGTNQSANITVQAWELTNRRGAAQEIPLRGFYVAHLLSGDISITVDGQTTEFRPGAYWTVRAGATMQVIVQSEVASLETIVVAKQ